LADRHERGVRDAVDADGASDEGACSRTVKSCGPDASTLASNRWELFLRWRWQERPIAEESTKQAVKTIRAGKAGSFRRTCGDYTRMLILFCMRGCGRVWRPAFPAPSVLQRTGLQFKTRVDRAARSRSC